jgi:hypothetical protein
MLESRLEMQKAASMGGFLLLAVLAERRGFEPRIGY